MRSGITCAYAFQDILSGESSFGSTKVPGLAAKPIVDILVEVTSLGETRKNIAPILEAQGYDYFWRPLWGNNTLPFYAWVYQTRQQREQNASYT